jgi:hypothetical protein
VILDRKKSANRLVVDEAINDDNSVVAMHPATMEKLQFFRGDTVLIKPKKSKKMHIPKLIGWGRFWFGFGSLFFPVWLYFLVKNGIELKIIIPRHIIVVLAGILVLLLAFKSIYSYLVDILI